MTSRFILNLVTSFFLSTASLGAAPLITEAMASNQTTLRDDDGDYSDWIEIHNPDSTEVVLTGWYLTDKETRKNKWTFPAVTLPPNGYLLVYASGKNRATSGHPLHTNFKLSADGTYLGLIQPDAATVAAEFAPALPPQFPDLSYGVTQPSTLGETPQTGYFNTPTPGTRNGGADTLVIAQTVEFSLAAGPFLGTCTVQLSGAAPGQTIRYELVSPSSAGAQTVVPTATSSSYTGPLTITTSVIVCAAVFSEDGTRHGLVSANQYLKLDDSGVGRLDTFSSRLPLVVIDNHGFGPMIRDGIDRPAWLHGFSPDENGNTSLLWPAQHTAQLALEVRGATSSLFPKKSYKFDLVDDAGNDAPQGLFGLDAFEDWNLVGPWHYDRSYIRNTVVYELSRRMGHWAPRTQLVEVFFNGDGGLLSYDDYAGIYVLTDKLEVDPDRVNITKLAATDLDANAITGGYFLRVDEPDAEKFSWTTDHGAPEGSAGSVLLVEEPKLDKLAEAQRIYIKDYVQQMENALHADRAGGWQTRHYLEYLDRSSWVDYHLLNTFVKNTDAFWRSNYFTKDRAGKIFAGPVWDYDRSLDSMDPRDDEWNTWSAKQNTSQGFAVQYWENGWWGLLARDPDFMQAWVDRWHALRQGQFTDAGLAGVVENFAGQIGPEAAARDAARWPDNVSVHGDFAGEVDYLATWLLERAHWIDQQFESTPSIRTHAGQLVLFANPGAQLVYTLDGTDPRASGGGIASTAQVASDLMVFPDNGRLRARSYRPSQANVFPGSPWSPLVAPRGTAYPPINAAAPSIEVDDTAVVHRTGEAFALTVTISGAGPLSYQWFKDDVPIANGTNATLQIDQPTYENEGRYVLAVTNPFGTERSPEIIVTIEPAAQFANLSARADAGLGEDVLIAGFVVASGGPRRFLARAVGPGLVDAGITDPVPSPTLSVYSSSGELLVSNTGWETAPNAAELPALAEQLGAFPLKAGSRDSALAAEFPPGAYSLHVRGGNGGTGIGLVELYAVDERHSLLNLSSRARVGVGNSVLIGGLVVRGEAPQEFLIRAVGPGLSSAGVRDPLLDPSIEIVSAGVVLQQNDDWSAGDDAGAIAAASAATGAFPLVAGSKDAAMLVTLPPGIYSVIARGKSAAEGVALLEIYLVK